MNTQQRRMTLPRQVTCTPITPTLARTQCTSHTEVVWCMLWAAGLIGMRPSQLHQFQVEGCEFLYHTPRRPLPHRPDVCVGCANMRSTAACIRCVVILRSEEHTSELQSLMRISYAVFCLKKKKCNLNL